ncbi:MAG TPA: hypothetical protein VJJ22_03965 [Candidatus Paceibacterota bacterium]
MVENREEEILKLLKENNEILRSIRRRQHWQTAMSVLYWLIIGGVALASYHFLQPYLQTMLDTYSKVQDGINKITF